MVLVCKHQRIQHTTSKWTCLGDPVLCQIFHCQWTRWPPEPTSQSYPLQHLSKSSLQHGCRPAAHRACRLLPAQASQKAFFENGFYDHGWPSFQIYNEQQRWLRKSLLHAVQECLPCWWHTGQWWRLCCWGECIRKAQPAKPNWGCRNLSILAKAARKEQNLLQSWLQYVATGCRYDMVRACNAQWFADAASGAALHHDIPWLDACTIEQWDPQHCNSQCAWRTFLVELFFWVHCPLEASSCFQRYQHQTAVW